MRPIANTVAAVAVMFAVVPSGPAAADSLEVLPTKILLGTDGRAGLVNVVNRGNEPITAQIEAFDWSQTDGKDQLTPSQTLQVSPPMTHLGPGEKQVVRVRAKSADASGREQAYRLIVSEIPNPTAKPANGVRLLLQFKIPVFVGISSQTPRQLSWTARPEGDHLILSVSNAGTRHAKLAKLHVVTDERQRLEVAADGFTYVLPGTAHTWTIPEAGITSGTKLHIEGLDESDGTPINDAIVASQ